MASSEHSSYALNQCCLFKCSSRKKLAKLLFTNVPALEAFTNTSTRYSCWEVKKSNGGVRNIEAPHDNLKTIQKRIAELLQRIEPPSFLMAPVRKRSYVHNAAVHVGSRQFRLLDIEDFFPSCTDKRVFWFLHKVMLCAPDIAALLTKITTYGGHLPQGSPCSPILAYFAYVDMWGEIQKICTNAECKLSIYADDITVSGQTVFERDIWAVKQVLHRHGHSYSRKKERRLIHKAADITGVIVSGDDLLLPNRQHKQLAETRKKRDIANHGKVREKLDRQLRGREAQAKQILLHQQNSNLNTRTSLHCDDLPI